VVRRWSTGSAKRHLLWTAESLPLDVPMTKPVSGGMSTAGSVEPGLA
jgi:hypothetical protein